MGSPSILRFSRGLPQSKQFGERLRLLCIQGAEEGACYCLLGDSVTIGREVADIKVPDGNVSKKHAEINWNQAKQKYSIKDAGSSNGVLLNGEKITQDFLEVGDLVVIGASVMQVCAAGQTRKDAPIARLKNPKSTQKDGAGKVEDAKKVNEKRKLLVFAVIVFAIYIAYSSSDTHQTRKEERKIDLGNESATEPTKTKGPKSKADLEKEKAKKAEFIKTMFDEYVPKYVTNTPQHKEADKYYQQGLREYQNKSYRRAIGFFETALTVDPAHELAKVYLRTTKTAMFEEIKQDKKAAESEMKALRLNRAKIYYNAMLKLLEVSKDDDTYKNDEYFKAATDGIAKIEKMESSQQ